MSSKNADKTLVLVDFDHTITRHDSFLKFSLHAAGIMRLAKAAVVSFPWLAGWKLGLVDSGRAKEKLFGALFAGADAHSFRQKCIEFADIIEQDLNQDVMRRLDSLESEGARIAVVSASIADWIRPWAERHGFCDVIATEITLRDTADGSRITIGGSFATLDCKADEKVRRVRDAFPDLDSYRLCVFGNLPDDKLLLDMADTAVIV